MPLTHTAKAAMPYTNVVTTHQDASPLAGSALNQAALQPRSRADSNHEIR